MTLWRPTEAELRAWLAEQRGRPYNYEQVGGTAQERMPSGHRIDEHSILIGTGAQDFAHGRVAIKGWITHDIGWSELCYPELRHEPGQVFATLTWVLGIWTLNACRVIEVFDEDDSKRARFGFSFGTVEGHIEAGEERLSIVWDKVSDEVRYEVRAFTRLRAWLPRLTPLLPGAMQSRFFRDTQRRVKAFVAQARGG